MGIIKKGGVYWPDASLRNESVVRESIYKEAENPKAFWAKLAKEGLYWDKLFTKVYEEKNPFFRWFLGGKLNISYNCLDRHLGKHGDKIALIWIPEPAKEDTVKMTYWQLHEAVNKFANVLLQEGIKKGDVVSLYLPLIPEVIIAMLACARIGAIHSVVFSAFSSEALKSRILDGGAKLLVTADGYYRRGKIENLKEKADEAVKGTEVKRVIVVKRAGNEITINKNDRFWDELMKQSKVYCKPYSVNSEDPLFILYTSGTTGKPKGIVHETGGYAIQTLYTTKWNFNLKKDEIIWTTADIGWVTGHSYMCYGPLLCGATTLFYEGSIDYPDPGRVWKIIQDHRVNIFYTAPTALRMFRQFGDEWVERYNLSTLNCLGTVGEPIDQETWLWYFEKIGKKKLPIIDTWWQTETGGTMINSLAGLGPFIPGIAGKPFPGIRFAVCDDRGKILKKGEGYLIQLSPFAPGMLRTIWRSKRKYREKYFRLEDSGKKVKFYVSGDAAVFDGTFFKILGRTDDVIKVAGHRLSTAEMENIVHKDKRVIDVAVVGKEDPLKGSVPIIFIKVKESKEQIRKDIVSLIEREIGHFAKPHEVYPVPDLPKTRSGKIMRRILRSLLQNGELGELSTLVNPECIDDIRKVINNKKRG